MMEWSHLRGIDSLGLLKLVYPPPKACWLVGLRRSVLSFFFFFFASTKKGRTRKILFVKIN